MGKLADFFLGPETKAAPIVSVPIVTAIATPAEVRADLAVNAGWTTDTVNQTTALQVSAALCCARVIAEGLAQVPCRLMKEDKKGSLVEARDHPLFWLLKHKPNAWQTSFELREQMGLHLAFDHNAFVYINRVRGEIKELYAFKPNTVTVSQTSDMDLVYKIKVDGREREIPAADMWHVKGPSWDGVRGNDAIKLAAKTIGLAQATEKYGTKLFENGARPGGILTTKPGATSLTPEQRKEIMGLWQAQHRGPDNAHKTVMLPYDLDFTTVSGTANEAQWIENRKFLIEEICRFFRVLPIMVMQTGATSYASVEQLFLAHLTHTLMPWYERFEQSAETTLLTRAELEAGYTIKLNANALLRGSTAERGAYYNTMVTLGVMSPNEVRAKEDLPLSDDPEADKLRGAANLFGNQPITGATPNNPETEEVVK